MKAKFTAPHFAATLAASDGRGVTLLDVLGKLVRLHVTVAMLTLHWSIVAFKSMFGGRSPAHLAALFTVRAPNERVATVDAVFVHGLVRELHVAAICVFLKLVAAARGREVVRAPDE